MWNWLKSPKVSSNKQEITNMPVETLQDESPTYKIIIITGTSGSGRKSTAKQLSSALGIPYVFPYTTRAIRPRERDGEHYHFISNDLFKAMKDRDEFFQTVHLERGNYGISKADLFKALEIRQTAIVVVNHEGAQAFRARFGDAAIRIFIFVTKDDIRLRLERESVSYEILEEYLRNYTEQVMNKRQSEFLLQNLDPADTIEKIKVFIQDKL